MLLVAFFLLAGMVPAGAAPEPEPEILELNLYDALRRAEEVSQDLKIAASQIQEAEAQVVISRAPEFPQVNADFSYLRTIRTPFEVPGSGIPGINLPFGQKNTWISGFDISQTVYSGGRVRSGIGASRQSVAIARAQSVETREDVKMSVIEAFLGANLAERLAEISRLSAEQAELQLKEVRLKREAGNASDLDVSRAEVERENFEPERVDALNSADMARHKLMQILNLPAGTKLRIKNILSAIKIQPLSAAKVDEIATGSLKRRSSLEAANRTIARNEEQGKTARASLYPTVTITSRFGGQAFPGPVFPVWSDWYDDWNIGFAVRVGVLDWGRRNSQIAVAREQILQSTLQRDQLVYSISLDVEQRRSELSRAEALLAARTRTAAQAEKVFELTKLSFSVGSASHLQMTDARSSLQKARINEVRAVYDYVIALGRLYRAAGIPIDIFEIGVALDVPPFPTADLPRRSE